MVSTSLFISTLIYFLIKHARQMFVKAHYIYVLESIVWKTSASISQSVYLAIFIVVIYNKV